MKLTEYGKQKIKEWEGLRLTAYKDSAGVLTIGYGHTSAAGGLQVKAGMKITEKQADELFEQDIKKFEDRVNILVKVPLTPHQFDTLVSFDLNTGALGSSTLLKKLNARKYDDVPGELMKWVKITDPKTKKKVTLQGLVNRRAAECGLWAKGEFVSSKDVKAVASVAPILTKENISWGAGLMSSLGLVGTTTGPIQYALAAVLVIGVATGAFLFIKARLKE